MVYGKACGHRIWNIWYGLVGMEFYMVWSSGAYHGIWHGLPGIPWYMAWHVGHGVVYDMSGGHSMVYGIAWRAWHGI